MGCCLYQRITRRDDRPTALNPDEMRTIANRFAPELSQWTELEVASSNSTWDGNLSNGKFVEYLTICMVMRFVADSEFNVRFDPLLESNPDFFYLRNQLPLAHGARPGNSAIDADFPLSERYLASFVPKLTFDFGEKKFGVFREGFPGFELFAYLNDSDLTRYRSDLLILPGSFTARPKNETIHFTWSHRDFSFNVVLRTVNSPSPQIIDYELVGDPPRAVVLFECSVGKTKIQLERQTSDYLNLSLVENKAAICYSHLRKQPLHNLGFDLDLSRAIDSENGFETQFADFSKWMLARLS